MHRQMHRLKGKAMPSYKRLVTTAELANLLAGGDDYIRTKSNRVLGLALRTDLNPDAPDFVVFGKGPRIISRAELFLSSGVAVPDVYVVKPKSNVGLVPPVPAALA